MASFKVLFLGLLLFLLFLLNNLNQVIKFCKVYYFADNTNLLFLSNSIKKLNKLVNVDFWPWDSQIAVKKKKKIWLIAIKVSLNIVIFKSKQKKFEGDLKIRSLGKRPYPTESVKYLGVKFGEISLQCQINDVSITLNRNSGLLFKVRKCVTPKILRYILLIFCLASEF